MSWLSLYCIDADAVQKRRIHKLKTAKIVISRWTIQPDKWCSKRWDLSIQRWIRFVLYSNMIEESELNDRFIDSLDDMTFSRRISSMYSLKHIRKSIRKKNSGIFVLKWKSWNIHWYARSAVFIGFRLIRMCLVFCCLYFCYWKI